jgi:uncharacterized protein (DUF58 family)
MRELEVGANRLPPAVVGWLQRWVNIHRVLWVLTLACLFVAWNRGLALLYGLFSLSLALLLISHLMPRWQLRGLSVERLPSGELYAGKGGVLDYRLISSGKRYHIVINERLPFAEGEYRLFFSSNEPDQAQQLIVQCERRGFFQLRDIEVSSSYPFGIVTHTRRIAIPLLELIVLPQVFELRAIPSPLIADVNREGDVTVLQQGGHGQFATVREYMHGDELRTIHWRASARLQQWVVKEYERNDNPALLIVLDCRSSFLRGEGARSTFEAAISVAASMVRYASRTGLQSTLIAENGEWQARTTPAYSTDLYDLYEFLARLEPVGSQSGALLIEQAIARFPQVNLVTGFRLDSDESLPELPANLTHIDIEMDAESYQFPMRKRRRRPVSRDGNRLTYRVDAMTSMETLFQ